MTKELLKTRKIRNGRRMCKNEKSWAKGVIAYYVIVRNNMHTHERGDIFYVFITCYLFIACV